MSNNTQPTDIAEEKEAFKEFYDNAPGWMRHNCGTREALELIFNAGYIAGRKHSGAEQNLELYKTMCHSQEEQIRVQQSRIASLEAAEQKWISVEERLPEDGCKVLAFSEGKIRFCKFSKNKFRRYTDPASGDEFAAVRYDKTTHWQQLPSPPLSQKDSKTDVK